MNRPLFTVFTPTYNRAHTLSRVYESLCAQTYTNFEWLIVDDGSTDGTSALVGKWIESGRLRVRYLHQANAGKHVAFNRGVREASGYLFVPLDSDDRCVATALERFALGWNEIPVEIRERYTGITCLIRDNSGEIVGGYFGDNLADGSFTEQIHRFKRKGDMWGLHRTDVLREHLFPEFKGEKFCPEGLIWNRIATKYRIRFINEVLLIAEYQSDGLSSNSINLRLQNPVGTVTYYMELLGHKVPLFVKLKAATNIWRFAFLGERRELALHVMKKRPVFMTLTCIFGILFALRDKNILTAQYKTDEKSQVTLKD